MEGNARPIPPAAVCTNPGHDHVRYEDGQPVEGESTCAHCGRRMHYDSGVEEYVHTDEPQARCFLIDPASPRAVPCTFDGAEYDHRCVCDSRYPGCEHNRPCINPADSTHSPYFCQQCDTRREDHISRALDNARAALDI